MLSCEHNKYTYCNCKKYRNAGDTIYTVLLKRKTMHDKILKNKMGEETSIHNCTKDYTECLCGKIVWKLCNVVDEFMDFWNLLLTLIGCNTTQGAHSLPTPYTSYTRNFTIKTFINCITKIYHPFTPRYHFKFLHRHYYSTW